MRLRHWALGVAGALVMAATAAAWADTEVPVMPLPHAGQSAYLEAITEVQRPGLTRYVWGAEYWVNAADPNSHLEATLLYNELRTDNTWVYNPSRQMITFSNASAVPGGVVGSSAYIFRSPDGRYWKYVSYIVHQPQVCDGGGSAGILRAYWGNSWDVVGYGPVDVTHPTMPYIPCLGRNASPVEAVDALYDPVAGKIRLIGLEGNIAALEANDGTNVSYTYYAEANPATSWQLTIPGMISSAGIARPVVAGRRAYAYQVDLDWYYNNTTGTVYMARTYPYPYDPSQNGILRPCAPSCSNATFPVATFPNRAQVHKMVINGNWTLVRTGTWTLVKDFGSLWYGYKYWNGSACVSAPPTGSTFPSTWPPDFVGLKKGFAGWGPGYGSRVVWAVTKNRQPTACSPFPSPGVQNDVWEVSY